MSANAPARGKARKADYYKWAVGVGVPIAIALIALFKPGSSGDAKTSGNFTYVGSISVIENQYQQTTGQPLKDEGVKAQLTAAMNLAKAGQYDASLKILEQVAPAVPVPAVYNAIGSFYAEKGDTGRARQSYQQAVAKDPTYKPALENLKALQTVKPESRQISGGRESEPNNDILTANVLGSDGAVTGEISAEGDSDFFRLATGHPPRDIYRVSFKNNSTTLMPDIKLYDSAKNQVFHDYRTTPGADLDHDFSPTADATYYVQLAGFSGTSGAYLLSVKPLHRFDRFEPNDDIASAKPIDSGSAIDANVMDGSDDDYYRVKSGAAPSLTVTLKNTSTTLMPNVYAYDSQKNQVFQEYRSTPGADLERKFDVQPNASYYIRVGSFSGTSGAYSLTVK